MYLSKYFKSASNNWGGPLILLVNPQIENGNIDYRGYVQVNNKLFKDTFVGFQPVDVQIELINERYSSGKPLFFHTTVKKCINMYIRHKILILFSLKFALRRPRP
jgi:hypothetical protein